MIVICRRGCLLLLCCGVWYSERWSRLDLIFLCRFDCAEGIKQAIKWFVLFFLVSHFNALRRRLHQLIEWFNLPIVHATAWYECFQWFHVRRVLHDRGSIRIAASRIHLLIVRGSSVTSVATAITVHLLKQVWIRGDKTWLMMLLWLSWCRFRTVVVRLCWSARILGLMVVTTGASSICTVDIVRAFCCMCSPGCGWSYLIIALVVMLIVMVDDALVAPMSLSFMRVLMLVLVYWTRCDRSWATTVLLLWGTGCSMGWHASTTKILKVMVGSYRLYLGLIGDRWSLRGTSATALRCIYLLLCLHCASGLLLLLLELLWCCLDLSRL